VRAQFVIPGDRASGPSVVDVPSQRTFGGLFGRFVTGVKISFFVFGTGLFPVLFMPFLLPLLVLIVLLTPFFALAALRNFYDVECPYCVKMTRVEIGSSGNACGHCRQPLVFESLRASS